jgi:hypothetical protein
LKKYLNIINKKVVTKLSRIKFGDKGSKIRKKLSRIPDLEVKKQQIRSGSATQLVKKGFGSRSRSRIWVNPNPGF